MTDASPKELWRVVKDISGTTRLNSKFALLHPLLKDTDTVNAFFANISTNLNYNRDVVNAFSLHTEFNSILFNYEIEPILRRVKRTTRGFDGLPAWLFQQCSYELADVVTGILNCSFSSGTLPSQWLTAVISLVPKVSAPKVLSDYRPISVTPIMSRIAEKLLVTRWLRPSIHVSIFQDQFAFKPNRSTTCALSHFMHHTTRMLETNKYVRCLMIDFAKAFDVVDHAILLGKLQTLGIDQFALNWIVSFLSNRRQVCKIDGSIASN